ncbi:YhfC family intramembrane metalloprotease [Alkaliphilus transvaalensis]|uniref:YhfC family intramembrane metalloprotease n=1 Tax=Alkaliphilus transvaalensis TaxID=114628 RepID=UPI0006881FAB|nr:YhfC family glutamic-type intramembrane protease [Alkaliphilus transvaalensis]
MLQGSMISLWSIIFSIITVLLALVLPVVLAIGFCRRYNVSAKPVLIGALTFFVTQIIIRIPLLQLLEAYYPWGTKALSGGIYLFTYALFLSITAALFEEGGRFIFYRGFLRKYLDWKNAVAFGIGHGGIEAILLVGINYVVNTLLMIFIYTENLQFIPTDINLQLGSALILLIDTPPVLFLVAGIERLLTLIVHIGFSVLVVYGIKMKDFRYVFYAFLGHFLLNLPAAYMGILPGGIWLIEGYVAVFAILSYIWIKKSKLLFEEEKI